MYRTITRRNLLYSTKQYASLFSPLLLLLYSLVLHAEQRIPQKPTIPLTAAEQAWLLEHPRIRVSNETNWPPYDFNTQSMPQGFSIDYLNLIASKLGIQFDYVTHDRWSQLYEQFEAKQIDLLHPITITPQRIHKMHFSDSYFEMLKVLVVRKDNQTFQSLEDLKGKTLAIAKSFSTQEYIEQHYPEIVIHLVDSSLDGLKAVSLNQADAYIDSLGTVYYLMHQHFLANLVISPKADLGELGFTSYHIAIRQDWPMLQSIINKAIESISVEERQKLIKKWNIYADRAIPIKLTESEKKWLAEHRNINLAVDPDFAPIEFMDDDGNHAGIAADYIDLLNQRLGISMKVIPDLSWSQAIALAKQGKIDAFAAITPSDERKQYLHFTQPYIQYPLVIFTQDEYPFIVGLEDLINKRIVVVENYIAHDLITQHYPHLELTTVKTIKDALAAVSAGDADAFIGDTATSTYVIRTHHFTNLKIAAPTQLKTLGHSLAVRKDWPELVGILNKGLNAISTEEQLKISKKWIDIEVDTFPIYWVWISIGAASLTIIFIIISTLLRQQVKVRTREITLKNELLQREAAERERAEYARIESEKRLWKFFHATFEMVFFHRDGEIIDVNPAALKVTGYSPDQLIGKNILNFATEASRPIIIANMGSSNAGPYEIVIVTQSKEEIPVEVHASSIHFDGTSIRVVSLRDISERKKNEMALKQAYDELERKVAERTRDLLHANEKLKELDKLKSMFIASVSHELRTPLNSIIGFSGTMLQQVYGKLDDKYLDYSKRINRSGQHLLGLIIDIIDVSKIESGRIDVITSDFTVNEVLAEVCETLQQSFQQKSLYLRYEPVADITLHTDKKRLLQCILNLTSNAMKFTESGGVAITVDETEQEIKISVKDTGVGISQEDLTRLFEPFERIHSHLNIKAGGTGLGLYLTKKIAIDLLRGDIGVESKLNAGSLFWIRIPKVLMPVYPN